MALGLGWVFSLPYLTPHPLWELQFKHFITLLGSYKAKLTGLTSSPMLPGIGLLKPEVKEPCGRWDPIPGEVNLKHLKCNFPECLVIDANAN